MSVIRGKIKAMMKLWVDKNNRGGEGEAEMKESGGDMKICGIEI